LTIYADSSFVVPLYASDVHSQETLRRMALGPLVWLTPFNRTELAHSLNRQVFRARISDSQARFAWAAFEQDCAKGIWIPAGLPERIWEASIDLARRYGPALGIRTLDSLHVACALELRAQRFWTFDERQAKLAEAVGLDTTP
jgi:predicted nucleic acid-binding protein